MVCLSALATMATALASVPDEVQRCLDRIDTDCAERALTALGASRTEDADLLAGLAETRFYQGSYPDAYDTMKRAVDAGYVDRFDELPLFERTLYATANWVEETEGRFAVRFRPGLDAILVREECPRLNNSPSSN